MGTLVLTALAAIPVSSTMEHLANNALKIVRNAHPSESVLGVLYSFISLRESAIHALISVMNVCFVLNLDAYNVL